MSYPKGGYPAYGFDPWRQQSWDARAAGNFIGGGAGSGLIVFAAVAQASGTALGGLMLAGLTPRPSMPSERIVVQSSANP